MKKLLTTLIILISINTFSQQVIQDIRLSGYLSDFMNEATNRGYNINKMIYSRLVSIEVSNLEYPNLGQYTAYNRTIRVSPYVLLDETLTRLTVYHELGHVLKLGAPHSCNACSDIMSAAQYKSICYYKDEKIMKMELDKLFKWAIDE